MTKWEYKILTTNAEGFLGFGAGIVDTNELQDVLNRLGEEGWELTSAFETNTSSGGTRAVSLILKRQMSSFGAMA